MTTIPTCYTLTQHTAQNECRLKLYQSCDEKDGQAPEMLSHVGREKPVKTSRTHQNTTVIHSGYVAKLYHPPENNQQKVVDYPGTSRNLCKKIKLKKYENHIYRHKNKS